MQQEWMAQLTEWAVNSPWDLLAVLSIPLLYLSTAWILLRRTKLLETKIKTMMDTYEGLRHRYLDISALNDDLNFKVNNQEKSIAMLEDQLHKLARDAEVTAQKSEADRQRLQILVEKKDQEKAAREKAYFDSVQMKDAMIQSLREEVSLLKKEPTSPNPEDAEEVMRLRSRLKKTETLYKSMKGLKEIAEERSTNWEKALEHLAGFVHEKIPDPSSEASSPQPLGQNVARALEKIGKDLGYAD